MRYSDLKANAGLGIQYDVIALVGLAGFSARYIPWTESALRPSAIKIVLNDICLNNRVNAIEFGAGVSTLFVAETFARNGGLLVSVDHDLNWIRKVESWLPRDAVSHVRFVHAPLRSCTYLNEQVMWYATEALSEIVLQHSPFDLVVVDGPPAYMQQRCLNRGPALSFLEPHIRRDATIVLDDINRVGEKMIAQDWSTLIGREATILEVEAGIALWRIEGTKHTI